MITFLFRSCSKVQNRNLYLATFASVLGPLSFGFVLGYSSPAIPNLKKSSNPKLRLDDSQASWFGVSLCCMSECVQLIKYGAENKES